MKNQEEARYVKRTQKDYTMSFKLQIVQWLRKFGNFDWDNQTPLNMSKSPEQKIMELEVQVKLLEKQKALLERQAFVADKKVIIFDMLIDIAEKEYQIDIRKNSTPEQSTILNKKNNKQ